jgi:hypothetical protein
MLLVATKLVMHIHGVWREHECGYRHSRCTVKREQRAALIALRSLLDGASAALLDAKHSVAERGYC